VKPAKLGQERLAVKKKRLFLINLFPSISINKLLGNLNPEPWATQVGIDDLTQTKTNIRYYDMIESEASVIIGANSRHQL